ncbi:hypothetical protein SDC9_149246 [bioreactor metagenome]|uniref:Uncharacterized protein n=1 Tax=bioreactor metagenome TaxID=1076179 RepID=A0A645ENB0_9ZZZZ
MLHRGARGGLGRHLRCKRRGLFRAAETQRTCARPAQSVPLQVGDGYEGVVEGGTDVRGPALNVLALAALARGGCLFDLLCCCHVRYSSLPFLAALRALGSLARAGVLLGALSANRQALTVPYAAVATDLDQSLDVHRGFAAKIALHLEIVVDVVSELRNIAFSEVAYANVGVDAGRGQYFQSGPVADPIDIGQTVFDPFVSGKVNARNTCHIVPLPP